MAGIYETESAGGEMKLRPLSKSRIETFDYSFGAAVGCTNNCSYCYARKLVKRFPKQFGNKPFDTVRTFPDTLKRLDISPDGKDYFVCPLSDLWCKGFPGEFRGEIFKAMAANPNKRFFLQTKNPSAIWISEKRDLPKNCWLGTTITGWRNRVRIAYFAETIRALTSRHRFYVSIEPLGQDVFVPLGANFSITESLLWKEFWERPLCNWIIVGPQTNPVKQPPMEAIKHIRAVARENDIPLWEKSKLATPDGRHIQERSV